MPVPKRPAHRLLAIPPESAKAGMAIIAYSGAGVPMRGEGSTDFLCGRCGRLLLFAVDPGQIRNLWFTCGKCGWLNGMDIDLGWAQYVIEELETRRLSLERLERLIEDVKTHRGPVDELVERNSDVGPWLRWVARIGVPALLTLLTLLYTIYSTQQSHQVAEEQLDVAREQLEVSRDQAQPRALTPEDLRRLADELHRLQEEIQIKPPPRSPRSQSRRGGRR
jgi:hypothetical protein